MADGAAAVAPAARGTQREIFSPGVTPVDEKRFESEIRRIDATLFEEKKSREKFETRIEKSVSELRGEMNARFDKADAQVNARFDKMDAQVNARFDKVDAQMNVRFGKVADQFEKVADRFDRVESEIKELRGEMHGNFKATITIYLTMTGILLAAFYAFSSYTAR